MNCRGRNGEDCEARRSGHSTAAEVAGPRRIKGATAAATRGAGARARGERGVRVRG